MRYQESFKRQFLAYRAEIAEKRTNYLSFTTIDVEGKSEIKIARHGAVAQPTILEDHTMLSRKEVCILLDVSSRVVYGLWKRNELNSLKIGADRRFFVKDVITFLNASSSLNRLV